MTTKAIENASKRTKKLLEAQRTLTIIIVKTMRLTLVSIDNQQVTVAATMVVAIMNVKWLTMEMIVVVYNAHATVDLFWICMTVAGVMVSIFIYFLIYSIYIPHIFIHTTYIPNIWEKIFETSYKKENKRMQNIYI